MGENPQFGNIIFRSEDDNYQREQFDRFQQRGVVSTRYPDLNCLQELGLLQGVQWLLRLSDLTFLCSQNQPTYPSLTLEFLSSYSYTTPIGEDEYLTGTATFRMFNTEYSLSQDQLSAMLHFPEVELDRSRSRESHCRSGNSGFWSYAYGTRQYAYEMAGTRMDEALRVWFLVSSAE
ncbi:hypothetical protein KIW84_040326 [Lathyrus oleraceus]|uniref:Arabidopsis retrotransposon Orf1 C-terminal domain-containing protein n=1 Tax=Pisum sativum TaxID=3888 RepID=A0A9D5AMV0_PEA|nr:hypothetical protein KIW84_040326 [Pisum sativum]